MKKFITLNKYGELYIDKILFETYFPIIFTCKNENNDIFICVCCQCNENGCKWLVGRTNGSFIVRMLQNEITIRQLLLDCCTEKISVDYKNQEYAIAYNNSDWNEESDYLPKKDAYIDAEGGEFDEESNICSYGMDLFQRRGELWERSFEEHQEYAYSEATLRGFLKDAGFTRIEVFADRKLERPGPGEQRIYFKARKGTIR